MFLYCYSNSSELITSKNVNEEKTMSNTYKDQLPMSQASILKIIKLGNPILTKLPNKEIEDPSCEKIRNLAKNMIEAMLKEEGVGLAAPQIGENLRIIVYRVPENLPENLKDPENPEGIPITIMINPFYEPMEEDKEDGWEGCISLPGLYGKVPRFKVIKVKYQDLEGNITTKVVKSFHARILQHEIDHIEPEGGIIYTQRMPKIEWGKNFGFVEEIKEFVINSKNKSNAELLEEKKIILK